MHGQARSKRQHLRSPALQRELLDRYGGAAVAEPLAAYRAVYQELLGVRERLGDLLGQARERAREADALRLGLAEVAAVNPQPDEESTLIAEIGRLEHADALRAAASTAQEVLGGEPDSGADTATLLRRARRALDAMSAHDPQLADLAKRAAEISYLLADLIGDLASYAAEVEVDPARLAAANDRRAALTRLLRKYGDTADEVLAWANETALRLAELDSDVDTTAALRERETALQTQLTEQAKLSAARRAAAARLQKAVGGRAGRAGDGRCAAFLSVTVRR